MGLGDLADDGQAEAGVPVAAAGLAALAATARRVEVADRLQARGRPPGEGQPAFGRRRGELRPPWRSAR
ncbi:hypothetical protein [Nonomuraea sp. NPDC048916]|uniref:hypothetical protein n=1 Tax=Nonomuraea sp. NPDC048916 TaxID=3154232 RepID=UPI0033CB0127